MKKTYIFTLTQYTINDYQTLINFPIAAARCPPNKSDTYPTIIPPGITHRIQGFNHIHRHRIQKQSQRELFPYPPIDPFAQTPPKNTNELNQKGKNKIIRLVIDALPIGGRITLQGRGMKKVPNGTKLLTISIHFWC